MGKLPQLILQVAVTLTQVEITCHNFDKQVKITLLQVEVTCTASWNNLSNNEVLTNNNQVVITW